MSERLFDELGVLPVKFHEQSVEFGAVGVGADAITANRGGSQQLIEFMPKLSRRSPAGAQADQFAPASAGRPRLRTTASSSGESSVGR